MKNKVNEIQVRYKEKIPAQLWANVSCSRDAADLSFRSWNKDTIGLYESFKILLLNNSNRVKGIFELSKGGITGTLVDIRIVFAVILKSLSVGVILAHNHPSGKLKASASDRQLTQKIKTAAELFDIKLLDHIILAPNGSYFSFADEGIL